MSAFDDLVPVAIDKSDVSLDKMVLPTAPTAAEDYGIPSAKTPTTSTLDDWANTPSSFSAKLQPETFDWEKSNADRYVNSTHYKELGFEPYAGTSIVDGKPFDNNELRYGQVQTFGDVMKNAVGGAFHLAVGSFEQSVESWGHTINAIFGWNSDNTFKERLIGTPEELLVNNKKQEDIMNKYAIYHTPYSESHLFSKEFLGDITQQMGFGLGMGVEILGETLLTAGIGEAVGLGIKGASIAAKGVEAGEIAAETVGKVAPRTARAGEQINDLRKVSDLSTNRPVMELIWKGGKAMIPGADAISDISKAYKAGATGYNLFKAGVPGVIKTFSMANAAKAESMMEAANTYGQLYGDLTAKYQNSHDGQSPIGDDLQRIKDASYGAATDNFIVNTGLLMTMNQLEFGNMFSKFGSAKRLLREAAEEGADKEIFTVAKGEKRIAYQKATGPFSTFRNAREIRKDFGLGTALWHYGAKVVTGQAAKFEIAEGIQEVLQNTSDQTFRDYYTNLYDGSKDIHGNSFFKDFHKADFGKGLDSQNLLPNSRRSMWESSGGWKTFLMGATTGLFMSPLSSLTMYAHRKGYGLINKDYRSKLEENRVLQQQNKDLLNAFYADPSKMLDEHIANMKVQGEGVKTMADAAKVGDKYTFTNAKQDMFTKAVATAIKTDNYDSFIDHIKEFADKFHSDQEFEQAFPTLKSRGATPTDMRAYIHSLADDITQYHTNWQNLKDKYSGLVMPELYNKDPKQYVESLILKKALDNAIETLATTDWNATQAVKRAGEIKMTMGAIPGIGTSVNKSFEVLGHAEETERQIVLLQQEIATYDALDRDPEIADIKKNAREQLKHLQKWQEGITEDDGDKMRNAHKDYILAVNRELNTGPQQTIQDSSIDQSFDALGDYINLNRDNQHYIDALNTISHLQNFRKMVDRHVDGIHYFERMVTQQMYKEFKERADQKTGTTTPQPVPTPEEPETPVELPVDPRKDIIDHYTSDEITEDVPKLLGNYLDQHPDLAEKLDILQGQREKMSDELYKKHLNEILDEHFNTQQEEEEESEPTPEPIPEVPKEEGPKLKIPHSQITIAPAVVDDNGELVPIGKQTTEQKLAAGPRVTRLLSTASVEDIQEGLSLTVRKNQSVTATRTDIGNPDILTKGQQYWIQLNLYGAPLGFLTNADQYIFKIDGKELSVKDIDASNIQKVMDIPTGWTLERALEVFQTSANIASTIQTEIEQRLKDVKDGEFLTIGAADTQKILSIYPRITMNWLATGEIGPVVSDISDHIYRNEYGQMVVVSNRINDDGTREMIQGTQADLQKLHKIPAIDNLGTYSIALQIAGDTRWVQITPTHYTQLQLQSELTTLTALLQEKEPSDEQVQQIKDIIHGIFIAIPEVHSREEGKKVTSPALKWNIRLEYSPTSPDKAGHIVVSTNHAKAPVLTLEGRDISTPEKLADAIQKVLNQKNRFPGVKVTQESFRHQVPLSKGQATTDAIMSMTASVHPNVVKSISLVYGLPVGKSDLQQESMPDTKELTTEQKIRFATPLPKKNKEQDAQKAVEEVDFSALENTREEEAPFKIVPTNEPFNEQSVEHIDSFKDWVSKNLPEDIISVQDMGILEKNLQDNNITVGQFIRSLDGLRGHLQVYKNSPYKYHEAFHAIFRLLLPQTKIAQLLEIAGRENKVTESKLQAFKDLHPTYAAMSREYLIDRFHEEYLADKFDKWMMDKKTPTSHIVKGFFAQILDWIKALWSRLTGSQLEGLFSDINKGRYKNAELQKNQFTDIQNEGINTPVLKVIKIGSQKIPGKDIVIDRYLPQELGDQIVSGIVNLFYKAVGDSSEYNKGVELNKILKVYRDTYDTSLPIYKSRASAITDLGVRAKWMNDLIDLKRVFNNKEALESLKEAVDFHLNLMGYKQELDDLDMETIENEVGSRNVDTAHRKSSPMSDYSSLSKFLRGYIGSTTYALDRDAFGNKMLVDGSPIYANVSANKVYNGLLKILSNHSDGTKLLNRMLEYRNHEGNPETVKFINRLLDEVGFNEETGEPTKDSQLLMQVIKGFNQYDTPYLFTQIGQDNRYKVHYANTRDAARNQFSNWRDAYLQLKKVSTKALSQLTETISTAGSNMVPIKDVPLEHLAQDLSEKIQKQTGIFLSPMYVKYLIAAGKDISARTTAQQNFIDLYNNVEAIDAKSISSNLIVPMDKGTDIFTRDTGITEKTTGSSPQSLLMKLAGGNAQFDESVNTMSFTNAENETIYSHGYPNYDFMAISDLNDPAVVQRLLNDPARASFLLSDPNFQVLLDRKSLKVEQIDGLRKVVTSINKETGEEFVSNILERNREDGVTFSSYNGREYLATLFGLYDVREQPDTKVTAGDNEFYKTPVAIRTIEAKNSIHMYRAPVIKSWVKGQLSAKALDILYGLVKTEYDRIGRVQQEINDKTGTISGYHTEGKSGASPRGLHFFNTKEMLGNLATDIETLALTGEDLEPHRKEIEKQLQVYWKEQVKELAREMQKEGLINLTIGSDSKMVGKNILAPSYLFSGMGDNTLNSKMNISQTDFEHNIAQVMVNDVLNTMGINQILFGDEAKSFMDPIDQVKRMAGANAQGPNMVVPFTNKEFGIEHTLNTIHHITYRTEEVVSDISGNGIDSDDGQMYCTEKGLRYMLFGFGKLNKVQSDILDNLANGKNVTAKEFFNAGGLKDKGAFNSYKLVYFDGQTYLKCSAIPLFKDLPGYAEDAHILRAKMEEYENRNSTVVFAHPVSVSKAMKQNVAGSVNDIEDRHFNPLQAKYMRQQLENPSNKLVITDPTQVKQLIMSEQVDSTPVILMGHSTTVGVVKAAYQNDIAKRIDNSYSPAVNSIFTLENTLIELGKSKEAGEATPKMATFMDIMKENLQATGADQQTIGFMETQNGQPVYNLNFPSTLEKFTQIFLNHFSRGVTAERVPGMTLALVSGALGLGKRVKQVISLYENGQPKEWKVITHKEYMKSPAVYKDAKRFDDPKARTFDGLSIGDYYIDDLRHNVPEFDKDGNIIGRFSEYIRPAHYREEMNGIIDPLRDSFAVRIPSDDKHSNIALRLVDFMPVQYGSVGIFPHELIEISGADFDIDKLYVQLADTYSNGEGSLIAYGTAETPEDQFEEYIHWQSVNNRQVKDTLKEIEDTTEGKLQQVFGEYGGDRKNLIQALKALKMPSTVQEFMAAGGPELNNGVLNNRILAQRLALQSNSHIAGEIANSPTSTKPLIQLADSLLEEFRNIDNDPAVTDKKGLNGIINILSENVGNVNDLLGKVRSFIANKEGARNIGATANAIQVYSLLNNAHVQIAEDNQITIDSHTYTGFNETREFTSVVPEPVLYTKGKNKGQVKGYIVAGVEFTKKDFDKGYVPKGAYTGTRIFSTLSTLLNAMTDNAKERLASRLGLNITALGYVSNMVSMGIPLKTSVLLMLQPSVRSYFSQVQKISGGLKTKEEQRMSKGRLLSDMVGDATPDNITTERLTDNIVKGTNDQNTLALLQQIDSISSTLMDISKVQKLSQGLPTSWEDVQRLDKSLDDLGIVYKNGEYIAKDSNVDSDGDIIPVDVRKLLLQDQKIIAKNLQVLAQVQQLSRKVFLEKTPLFQRVTDIARDNMKSMYPAEAEEFNKQLKFDTISYLSIRAYIHWLQNRGAGDSLQSLNHAMIYPVAYAQQAPGYEDIIDIMNRLREQLTSKNENYLVSKFLMTTTAEDSRNGINTVEANTWAKINELQQDRLVAAFTQLYSNGYKDATGNVIETHNDAVALFNYLLVKDGGQFKSGTFIRFIPTYMFKDVMSRTTEINELLSQPLWNEQRVQELFGTDSHTLLNDFMSGYGTHTGNNFYLQDIRTGALTINNPIQVTGEELTVNLYRNIIGYKKDRSDVEKEIITKNFNAVQAAGFVVKEGKIAFPYTIKRNGDLYILKGVGLKTGEYATDLIVPGESVSRGTHARYVRSVFTGAKNTFKSSSVFGSVPVAVIKKQGNKESFTSEDEEDHNDYEAQQQGDYPEQYEQVPVTVQSLQAQGVTFTTIAGQKGVIKDGNFYPLPAGTRIDAIPDIIRNAMPSVVPSISLQNMTSEQWKQQLSDIYDQKKKNGKDKNTWLREALNYRNTRRGTMNDTDIIKEIADCL